MHTFTTPSIAQQKISHHKQIARQHSYNGMSIGIVPIVGCKNFAKPHPEAQPQRLVEHGVPCEK